ncbi:hypothetical protein [Sphingomonas crocodyli]|uniref:Uncharacterized protein n=1 Tax=Sphingomonas crocodyli TaxID=1979270 RepID=A0A437M7N9_9SPHN|nr:hypothetical protein [Sphingomonas crocodyli]RVT93740.1 hypothetical protein EOD43_07700 [Sphingomonas crocodyli]
MTDPTIAALAGKLTEAKRAWLLNPGYIDPNSVRSLRRKGLLHERQRGLTELGRKCAHHLRTQGGV